MLLLASRQRCLYILRMFSAFCLLVLTNCDNPKCRKLHFIPAFNMNAIINRKYSPEPNYPINITLPFLFKPARQRAARLIRAITYKSFIGVAICWARPRSPKKIPIYFVSQDPLISLSRRSETTWGADWLNVLRFERGTPKEAKGFYFARK